MSVEVQVEVRDNATASIDAKLAKCSPERVGKIIGQPLVTFYRKHLAANPRNKRGWPSTGFWEEAADSVIYFITPEGVVLRADKQGLRQRWKGGPIRPVTRKMLAIPISPVSYGKAPSDFPGLFLLKTSNGAYLVQHGTGGGFSGGVSHRALGGNSGRRLKSSLNFLFKLSAGVDQRGNPNVIPSEDQFAEVAMAAIERAIA